MFRLQIYTGDESLRTRADIAREIVKVLQALTIDEADGGRILDAQGAMAGQWDYKLDPPADEPPPGKNDPSNGAVP